MAEATLAVLVTAGHVALTLLAGATLIALAVVDWRWRLGRTRELKLAHALGRNTGMTAAADLEAMRHPKTVYERGRLTKFVFHIPAHLVGELDNRDNKAVAEAKMKATIRGVMGHVDIKVDHARPRRPTGTVTLTRAEIPKPVPTFVDATQLVNTGRLVLPAGLAAGGRQIEWNIRPKGAGVAHALVYGPTGRGKTEALQTLAGAAIDRGHQVYVVDPKADDFEEWREQHICPVATDTDSIAIMVSGIRRERERRVRDFRKGRRMAMLASGDLPSIILVVDEMHALLSMIGWTKTKPSPVMDDLLNLAQQGRSAGIHLAVGTQYPTVDAIGGSPFRAQLEMVIALGAMKSEALGLTGITRDLTAYPPGRAIVSYPGTEVEVQIALSPPRVAANPAMPTPANRDESDSCPPDAHPLPTPCPPDAPTPAKVQELVAAGRNKSDVARTLGISRRTVNRYLDAG